MNSVAIIGPRGQLGTDLVKTFSKAGWRVFPITHEQMQVEDIDSVNKTLRECKSDWVINTAAFHKLEECEMNSEKSWRINAIGPQNVAQIAEEIKCRTVFVSTDYVFSGELPVGFSYSEEDSVSPTNIYGHSKAAGEIATLSISKRNIVARISSVFGSAGSSGKGGNFIETIIAKARRGEKLQIVEDIYMSPTYTISASLILLQALTEGFGGKLHAANLGTTTWLDFAREILSQVNLKAEISPSQTDATKIPRRPKNSSLNSLKSLQILSTHPSWENGLTQYLKENGHT